MFFDILHIIKFRGISVKIWMNYMCKNDIMTEIFVDYKTKAVRIKNHTESLLDRAFGINENPTFEDYENLLKERCIPETKQLLKLHLKEINVPYYDPLLIVEKTHGRMAGDYYWIDIKREELVDD